MASGKISSSKFEVLEKKWLNTSIPLEDSDRIILINLDTVTSIQLTEPKGEGNKGETDLKIFLLYGAERSHEFRYEKGEEQIYRKDLASILDVMNLQQNQLKVAA